MGQKHKDRMHELKSKAQSSVAFSYAAIAWGNCSYKRLRNNPPAVLFKRLLDCVEKVHECDDTYANKQAATAACWEVWMQIRQHCHWEALRAAKGVEGAHKLDLSLPEDWGNAAVPAVQRNNRYERPIQVLTSGTHNIFYAGIPDDDSEGGIDCEELWQDDGPATHDDPTLQLTEQYTWEGEVIGESDEEYLDEDGVRRFRPDLNRPCF